MKNLSSIDTMAAIKDGCLKTAVMQKLDWSELEYCNYQYEQGVIYLETYLSGLGEVNEGCMNSLLKSRLFWNWWKNHWSQRDKMWLLSDRMTIERRREIYKCVHNGKMLASDIHPNRVVMEESYADMIHQIIKEEVK